MTVRPSGSDDRWGVECVSEVSEKSPTHLAGAEANSGRLTAGDEKAMGSRGLASSFGWGVLTNTTEELSRRHNGGVWASGRRSRTLQSYQQIHEV